MMLALNPVFSLWVGPNVSDFLFAKDTLLYSDMNGILLLYLRTEEGWKRDTLVFLSPGIRHLCRCGNKLYVAHFHRVQAYVGDSVGKGAYFPFVISGMACRRGTLLLYDPHTLYAWSVGSAPAVLYHTEDDLKDVLVLGDTLLLLQRNYLLSLSQEPETVVVFEDLADIRSAHPFGKAYLIVFGSGEVVAYLPGRGRGRKAKTYLLMEGVRRVKVRGDTVAALMGDSIKVFVLMEKRRGRRWRR